MSGTQPIDLDDALFPPFTETSGALASKLIDSEDSLILELLSINGFAAYAAEKRGENVYIYIYWAPRPLISDPAGMGRDSMVYEWGVVSERVIGFIRRHPAAAHRSIGDYIEYRLILGADNHRGVAEAIGDLRRVAGLKPYTGRTLVSSTGYSSRIGSGDVAAATFLAPLLEIYAEPEAIKSLVSNNMLLGPISLSQAVEITGLSKATLSRIYRWLASIGAAVKLGAAASTRSYYVDLRHEVIVSNIMNIYQWDHRYACTLLPLIEGVTYKHWIRYPGPYRMCRETVEELRNILDE